MRRWYVVHTHPHAEERALRHLERQRYDTWLPLYRKRRRHAGRQETVLRPLFPRYLFVHVDLTVERWRPILSTVGVHRIVGGPAGPQPIRGDVIAGLKERASPDGYFDLADPSLKSGDRVRILVGPLADLEGIFQADSDAERVSILLRLMGREVRVTMRSDDVEAV